MAPPSIFLFVHFDFPRPFQPEYGQRAKTLHNVLENQDWIEPVISASGGLGAGPTSIWVFRLPNYAALDRLLHSDDPVSKAYTEFFELMTNVQEFVHEEVRIL